MAELNIKEIAKVIQGEVLNAAENLIFRHYHFDTRLIEAGHTLFFALKSEQNDGHRFVDRLQDKKKNNLAAVVSREFDCQGIGIPLIRVKDTLAAAHKLAAHVREKFRAVKYIGITGSAGKTTTKEFVYQILSKKGAASAPDHVYRSHLNWNNWIGMPFSILQMTGDEQFAVFELAMSYPGIGEIDLLAQILKPDVAVLLNVFPTHLEFLKTLENVATGKSEILNYLSCDSAAFVSGDSELILEKTASKKGRKIYFGHNPETNDIILKEIIRDNDTTKMIIDFFGITGEFTTHIVNRVHIENLFAAIVVAHHLGLKHFEIQAALQEIKPLSGRGDINTYKDFTIIDETYNSNPAAVKVTLDWIDKEYTGAKIAVLGDMLELGEKEDDYHIEIGNFFSGLNFDRLITVGRRALKIAAGAEAAGFKSLAIESFDNSKEAGIFLKEAAGGGSVILFKASRGIRLEEALKEFTGE
ncbi:MAG: UDP-N-acetylmuramoyl-tripeptide--D-alanyl-D-alanine ligase [Candidatus Aminicenantes bacterium]|nr:UDP-N-acetylmuramoyl-tripeptide--D-alanyl-D-alanine ligase [Candidatus Aminicenantes bacterium]